MLIRQNYKTKDSTAVNSNLEQHPVLEDKLEQDLVDNSLVVEAVDNSVVDSPQEVDLK